VAPEFGEVLNQLDYKSEDYNDRLENIASNRSQLELKLHNALRRGLDVYNLADESQSRVIKHKDIICELSHNPIVRTNVDRQYPGFYTTIALFSEILRYVTDANPMYEKKELQELVQACIREAKVIEESQDLLMVSEPSAMTYKGTNPANVTEIPPYIRLGERCQIPLTQGIYLNISGIGAVQQEIISFIKPFIEEGYAIYYPPSFKDTIEGATKIAPLNDGRTIFSNPAIIAVCGRSGWSSVWEAMLNGKPFITYDYRPTEDREIYNNLKTIEQKKIGVVLKKDEDPEEKMKEALALKPHILAYVEYLKKKYNTLNGIQYSARLSYKKLKH
jgi:hypothetical protein